MNSFFDPEPIVLAHRGDSAGYPENTMPAFDSAVSMGVDVIETDVHLTVDGEIVIWHDDTMEIMSGDKRKLTEMNWNEIKGINTAAQFTADGGKTYPYRNNPVFPVRLKDVLLRFKKMRFNVDLKDKSLELAKKYGKILDDLNAFNRVVTASFHNTTLNHFRKLYPQAITSCTSKEVLKLILLYRTGLLKLPLPLTPGVIQVPEYSGSIRVLSEKFISQLHQKGFKVQIWTVNEKQEMLRFLHMGVDGIFTDNPFLLLKILKKRQEDSKNTLQNS